MPQSWEYFLLSKYIRHHQEFSASIRLLKMPMPGYVFKDGGPIPDDELQGPPPSVIPLGDNTTMLQQQYTRQGPTYDNSSMPVTRQTPAFQGSSMLDTRHTPTYNGSSMLDTRHTSTYNGSSMLDTRHTSTSNSSSMMDTPTSSSSPFHSASDSHALANADHDVKGASQIDHFEPGVKDLGWTEDPENIPKPLVGGLPNEQLWLLVRRFNKVCWGFHWHRRNGVANIPPLVANVSCQSDQL